LAEVVTFLETQLPSEVQLGRHAVVVQDDVSAMSAVEIRRRAVEGESLGTLAAVFHEEGYPKRLSDPRLRRRLRASVSANAQIKSVVEVRSER
jgi:hypothetical protein